MCRGSSLPDAVGLRGGHVIVFDDITHLMQAERAAAWGEVARRLAHEIKNPLTPDSTGRRAHPPQVPQAV
jgi:nitrogen fixation/metabolism regulation signal transduction histidine kinase